MQPPEITVPEPPLNLRGSAYTVCCLSISTRNEYQFHVYLAEHYRRKLLDVQHYQLNG